MKIACIGDEISLLGFGLAGIENRITVEDGKDAVDKINGLISTREYGVILITSGVYEEVKDSLKDLKLDIGLPIFLEVPEIKLVTGGNLE